MSIGFDGRFSYKHYRNDALFGTGDFHNKVTDVGVAASAGLLIQTGSTAPWHYLAIGTGTQAASSSDTALQTELTTGGGERATGTPSRTTVTITNDTMRLVKTFTFSTTGSGWNITEAGIFNSADTSDQTLFCRQTFTAIPVVNSDTLELTYTCVLSEA